MLEKFIKYFIIFLLYLIFLSFFLIVLNILVGLKNVLIFNFVNNNFNFFNIFMSIVKYVYVYKFLIFENIFDFFYQLINFSFYFFCFFILKIYIYFKTIFFGIMYKEHIFLINTIYKSRGYVEFFAPLFFQPSLYRFFSFYIFFVLFFISLDWTEHFFESIDNTDSEFEIDFEAAFTWDNDPIIGKNFFYLGQRLALEKTSEGPDMYKINNFFYQSKKSKFSKYNREFLGGPEYLNVLDLFSIHETFHQVGAYEFFSPAFIVIFVSYESDYEFEFFFLKKLFHFFKLFFLRIFKLFFYRNIIFFFINFLNIFLYFFSYIFLFFKYIYKFLKK
jgi:hypothetical protein